MIRKNGTGGPGATQDQHENNRARTGKCAERDTERHKNNKETPTRDRPRSQREAAGGGKRKAKAAEPGRQEKRSKSRKNTQAEPTPAGYKPATGRAVTTRGAQQEPPKHTQSRKCEVSPRLTPSTPPAARRDSACTVVLGLFRRSRVPALGGLVSARLQHLLRSLDTAVKVDLHRSMAVALMAPVELRLVVAVMVADQMPWLIG